MPDLPPCPITKEDVEILEKMVWGLVSDKERWTDKSQDSLISICAHARQARKAWRKKATHA